MDWSEAYLGLGEGVSLKVLETPCAYNRLNDELYELSDEALRFLRGCDGTRRAGELGAEEGFLAYCIEEGLVETLDRPRRREVRVGENESPSLRYLMVEVTDRCNLRCRHCYLGDAGASDLAWDTLRRALDDFDAMGGLRLMVTGGEPLLYPRFDDLNRLLRERSFRAVLITNGTLMGEVALDGLEFQEVQFSVDGLEAGHDHLRGEGSYRKVTAALRETMARGIDVSVATVIHSRNLGELEALGEALSALGVSSWTLEFPVPSGRMGDNRGLMPDPVQAAPLFDMEWGWGAHEGAEGYACGAHLACLEPSGRLVKCGYYRDISGGPAAGGLRRAWRDLPRMRPRGACAACDILDECGGGCRYRAELMAGKDGPDPVMCARFGRAWG